jgi:3-hydroxyisobutyrate dehydrogenase-like beta-hydroxyacid dehydrogenase
MTQRIGFLGLGVMGAAISERLSAAGFAVQGWNRTKEKARTLEARGVAVFGSVREAAAGADVCCLCLTDASAVRDVLLGPDGARQTLRHGALVIDFSTIGVAAAQSLARELARDGVSYVDAPVSGGPGAAREGELAIMWGGDAMAGARAQPVFNALARRATHIGASGAGQAAKLCNQLIVSSNLIAISEAISLASALGIDAKVLPAALAGGYADSLPLQIYGPRMAETTGQLRLSRTATMLKDVREIVETARGLPINLRLAKMMLALYQEAADFGWGDEDLDILPRLSAVGDRSRSKRQNP